MMGRFKIMQSFKVLARVTNLSGEAEYVGDKKKEEAININLKIDKEEFVQMVSDSIDMTQGDGEQTVTVTVVP